MIYSAKEVSVNVLARSCTEGGAVGSEDIASGSSVGLAALIDWYVLEVTRDKLATIDSERAEIRLDRMV